MCKTARGGWKLRKYSAAKLSTIFVRFLGPPLVRSVPSPLFKYVVPGKVETVYFRRTRKLLWRMSVACSGCSLEGSKFVMRSLETGFPIAETLEKNSMDVPRFTSVRGPEREVPSDRKVRQKVYEDQGRVFSQVGTVAELCHFKQHETAAQSVGAPACILYDTVHQRPAVSAGR